MLAKLSLKALDPNLTSNLEMKLIVSIAGLLIGLLGCAVGIAALLESFKLTIEDPNADAADLSSAVSEVLVRYGWCFLLAIGSFATMVWDLVSRKRKSRMANPKKNSITGSGHNWGRDVS